jgi:hypothetical protein
MRGVVTLFLGSVIRRPVFLKAVSTSATVAVGFFCLRIAQAPVTWGVAIEVPPFKPNPPPGTEELMEDPGAKSERKVAEFEELETASDLVVFPTLIAVEMQPGALRLSVNPSFPDAAAVAIPTDRKLSIAAFLAACPLSHGEVNLPPPKLRLTAAKLY